MRLIVAEIDVEEESGFARWDRGLRISPEEPNALLRLEMIGSLSEARLILEMMRARERGESLARTPALDVAPTTPLLPNGPVAHEGVLEDE